MVLTWFNPGNPQYRRGVQIATAVCCSVVGVYVVVFQDYGKHEHVFSPVRHPLRNMMILLVIAKTIYIPKN